MQCFQLQDSELCRTAKQYIGLNATKAAGCSKNGRTKPEKHFVTPYYLVCLLRAEL